MRLLLTDRLSWRLVGWGMGNLTITQDARAATAAARVTNRDIGPDALICTAGIDSDVSTKELLTLDREDSYMTGGNEEPYPHPGRRIDRPAAPQRQERNRGHYNDRSYRETQVSSMWAPSAQEMRS